MSEIDENTSEYLLDKWRQSTVDGIHDRLSSIRKMGEKKKFIYDPIRMHTFNAVVAKVARKYNIYNEIPTAIFPSIFEFLDATIEFFKKKNVAQDDIDLVLGAFQDLEQNKVNK